MKVLIYSDLHCSYTSSILPIHSNTSEYTTRLEMIINTGRWISNLAKNENVDCIINGGDTWDSVTIRSEEVSAMSEFFSFFTGEIPHYIVVGNHEMLNSQFNNANAFKHITNVKVCDKPMRINEFVSVLPYTEVNDVTNDVLKSISNHLLVSHIDLKGSSLRDSYIMEEGVMPELVAEYFDFTANGHLHTSEKLYTTKNEVWNIGSVSSVSFVDNNEYKPSVVIYDTDTKKFKRFENPYSILFRKFSVDSLSEAIKKISKNYSDEFRYVLRITCPYSIRDDLRNYLDTLTNIVTYRVVAAKEISHSNSNPLVTTINGHRDMKVEFIKYLDKNQESLNYPISEYLKVLENI